MSETEKREAMAERTDFYAPPWRVTSDGYLARAKGGYIALRSPFRVDAFEGENRSDHTDAELTANAALIVTAVNSYEAMREALQRALAIEDSVTQGQERELREGYRQLLVAALASGEQIEGEGE